MKRKQLGKDLDKVVFPVAESKFAECWSDLEIVQRTVAQIPWRNNITLLDN
jgi:hypothetical protein